MKSGISKIGKALAALATFALLTACGKSLNCEIYGDNVKGRINFTSAVSVHGGTNIVIESSTNGFSTVLDRKTVYNAQGFLTVPYTYCIPTNSNVNIRAYQDDNNNYSWASG